MSFLFYGMDAAGDFIPIKQLREKYNRARHEVPYDEPEENGGDSWVGIAWFLMIWAFGEQDNLVTARILYKFSFLICFSKWANFLWFGIYKLYIT